MKLESKTKDLLKQNSTVRDLKKIIDLRIKVDDVPEDFIKKHFKDEQLITNIQSAIQEEHGRHIYACKIVKHLAKYAAKSIKNKTVVDDEEISDEQGNDSPTTLLGIDYSDHGSDPGYYEERFEVYDEIDLKN